MKIKTKALWCEEIIRKEEMAMSNLNLKGIWIPIEVLTDKNLSDREKMILAIKLFLSKENNNCFCTNRNNKRIA